MLPAEQPVSSLPRTASAPDGPPLSASTPGWEEDSLRPHEEDGLLSSAVIGGVIGFTIVFVLVCAGLLLNDMDIAYVLPSAVFVAAFGGVGFGAMQAAALHKPRSR